MYYPIENLGQSQEVGITTYYCIREKTEAVLLLTALQLTLPDSMLEHSLQALP